MRHYRIIAKGKVQGVGFRNLTKSIADKYGYVGSVENLSNGDVEIFVSLDSLDTLLHELQKGNGRTCVKSFEIEILESLDSKDFVVLR